MCSAMSALRSPLHPVIKIGPVGQLRHLRQLAVTQPTKTCLAAWQVQSRWRSGGRPDVKDGCNNDVALLPGILLTLILDTVEC